MAQQVLHGFYIGPTCYGYRSRRVSKLVEAENEVILVEVKTERDIIPLRAMVYAIALFV